MKKLFKKSRFIFLPLFFSFMLFLSIKDLTARADAPPLLTTRGEFLTALQTVEEGDILYVDDIDFTLSGTGAVNDAARITISKSITVKSGKPNGKSVLSGASFVLDGSLIAGENSRFLFENVVFDGRVEQAEISVQDWELSYDSQGELISPDPLKARYALSLNGNADATFVGCDFTGYMSKFGGAIQAYYGGEPNIHCRLNASFIDCRFEKNSAYYGGAMYLDGNQKNISIRLENCVFENNVCGAMNGDTWGGGAIFAKDSTVNMLRCDFLQNTANFKYLNAEITADARQGGALFLYDATVNATVCRFLENKASCGGGIGTFGKSVFIGDGCILTNNAAISNDDNYQSQDGLLSGKCIGGAIYAQNYAVVTLLNTSVYDNVAQNASGGIHVVYSPSSSSFAQVDLRFCSIVNNLSNTKTSDYRADELFKPYVFPYDIYTIEGVSAKGCLIVDELFEKDFPKRQLPTEENGYNYFASPAQAQTDGAYLPVKAGEHLYSQKTETLSALPLPFLQECFGDKYARYVGDFLIGSNCADIPIDISHKESGEEIPYYAYGIGATLPAVQKKGYSFTGWTLSDGTPLTENDLLLISPNTTYLTVRARFEKLSKPFPYGWIFGGCAVALACGGIALILLCRKRKPALQTELATESSPDTSRLTEREKQVLALLLEGKKRAEIATLLFVSEETIKKQITSIYGKLSVSNRRELFIKFR